MWTPFAFDYPEYDIAHADGPLFDYHFILSAQKLSNSHDFITSSFDDYHLYHGAKLNVSSAKASGIQIVFLGIGVDPAGVVITSERLSDIIKTQKTITKICDYLSHCGGRYLFMASNGKTKRLYLDPVAMYSAVCNSGDKVIASIPTLAVPGPIESNLDYPFWENAAYPRGSRFAFGMTLDRRVQQLLPNHYLDLKTWSPKRHWPNKNAVYECASQQDFDQSIERIARRHSQIIGALAEAFPVSIPVTGGQDSRLLVAFAEPHKDKIKSFYTHITNFTTERDSDIAEQICNSIDIPHTVFRVQGNFAQYRPDLTLFQLRRRQLLRQGYLIDQQDLRLSKLTKLELAAHNAAPRDHLILRGHVTDISKAVLWRKLGLRRFVADRNTPIPPNIGVKLMQLRPNSEGEFDLSPFAAKYDAWMKSLSPNMNARSIDMMGIEQYRPYSLGNAFNGHAHNFYLSPGNDRQIIDALLTFPAHMRADLHVNDALLRHSAPELEPIPFLRSGDNELRQTRAKLDTYFDTPSSIAKVS